MLVDYFINKRLYENRLYCLNECKSNANYDIDKLFKGNTLIIYGLLGKNLHSIVLYNNKYFHKIITLDTKRFFSDVEKIKTTEDKIIFNRLNDRISAILLKPIVKQIRIANNTKLVFLPDSRLIDIPYHALKIDDNFLINSYSVGITTLKQTKETPVAYKSTVVFIKNPVVIKKDFRDSHFTGEEDKSVADLIDSGASSQMSDLILSGKSLDSYNYYNMSVLDTNSVILNTTNNTKISNYIKQFISKEHFGNIDIYQFYKDLVNNIRTSNKFPPTAWTNVVLYN